MSQTTIYSGHRQGCPTIRTSSLAATTNALAAVAGRLGQAITLQIVRTAWLVFGSQADLDRWTLAEMMHTAPAMINLPLGIIVALDADQVQLAGPGATQPELVAAVTAANAATRTAPRCQWVNTDGQRCLLNVHDDATAHEWSVV